ncbi:MAG: glycoside hydrolase domain-containing protein [Phycisphaerales bacterium]
MLARMFCVAVVVCGLASCGWGEEYLNTPSGETLPGSSEQVGVWWASSGWKIGRDCPLPQAKGETLTIRAAKNEVEAAQLVIRPKAGIQGLSVAPGALSGPAGATMPAACVEILEVRYVNVTQTSDRSAVAGYWPDPLPPMDKSMNLEAGKNQPFWVRVQVPRNARAGIYEGRINLTAEGFKTAVPIKVEVYDFELPNRMTCVTAFGFSDELAYQYQGVTDPQQKRRVLEKYWANYSAHHISTYDLAPLDPIGVTWPDIRPPKPKWVGGQTIKNEKHGGERALLIFDDRADLNVTATYEPLVTIPEGGLRLRLWYRTAVPDSALLVTLNHFDASGKWISGGNNDISLAGSGQWQEFNRVIKGFPQDARSVQLHLRATTWTDEGEKTGLVWFDDVSLMDAATGKELLEDGGFEPPELPPVEREKLQVKFDFTAWDKAMERAIDHYGFNSFRLGIPGLGGGTFHSRSEPELLGFEESTPHYKALFTSYCSQIQEHLRAKGWLDEAFVYWFDEPDPKDYAFVNNGFAKLKAAAPDISRMLTEQVEPALIGGPNIWCPISNNFDPDLAEQRRQHSERFWWYVCTGPRSPYCTLFIDHPGTELRVWLWQTWQRKIDGILVWQTNYWTSSAGYPEADRPQNPYEDPMGWTSGYSTPAGQKRPWGNGDGRFVYPPARAADAHPATPVLEGPVDSIRWEMLRDGIEDYEYFVILRQLVAAKRDKLSAAQKDRYATMLDVPAGVTTAMTTFTKDPAPIEEHRDRLARAIAELSRL